MKGHAVTMLSLLIAACAPTGNAARTSAMPEKHKAPLHVTLNIEDSSGREQQSFVRGATVRFVFTIENATSQSRRFSYTFPPHRISVLQEGGEPAWQAWQGQVFPQVMRHASLVPGERKQFVIEWQTAGEPAGPYRVEAAFNAFSGAGERVALDERGRELRLDEKNTESK